MKLIISSRLYLVFSGLLVLLVCLLFGCEQQSPLKVKEENKVALGQTPAKEEGNDSSKKTVKSKKVDKIKLEKTKEEKKVEKEVLKWLEAIEEKCIVEDIYLVRVKIDNELDRLKSLGKSGISTLIEVFCEKDRKWVLRYLIADEIICEYLSEVGERNKRIFAPVIKVLKDRSEHEGVRVGAAKILADLKDKRAIEPLMELYKEEKNMLVREEIASALQKVKGTDRKVKLEKSEEEKKVEKEVLKWVRKIERKCLGGDTNPIGWIICGELDKIEKIGKPAIPTLIEVFCDKSRKWMLRYFIGNEILSDDISDERICEPVLKVLEDRNEHEAVRMVAVYTLNGAQDKRVVEPLIELLKTENNMLIARKIVQALGYLKDARAVEPLIKVLQDRSKDISMRRAAAIGLGKLNRVGGNTVEVLIQELRSKTDVRNCVIHGLGASKDVRAIEPLIDELRRGNMWAPEALGTLWKDGIHDDRIIEALIEGVLWVTSEDKVKQNSLMPGGGKGFR